MPNVPNLLVQREGLTTQLDYTGGPSGSPVYVGLAIPGSATSSAIWKIMKLTYSGSDLIRVQWADGDTQFDNIWDNRASLSYS